MINERYFLISKFFVMNFSRFLDSEKEGVLVNYLENNLQKDFSRFQEVYGYKGNQHLLYWLVFHNCFKQDISFEEKNGECHYLDPSNLFTSPRWQDIFLKPHEIRGRTADEMISMFSPLVEIAYDGRGGGYYATFFQTRNEILYYDADPLWLRKIPKTIFSLFNEHEFKKLPNLLKKIEKESNESLGILDLKYKEEEGFKLKEFNKFSSRWKMIDNLERRVPIWNKVTNEAAFSPFDYHQRLVSELRDLNGDYYQYENSRAIMNADIVSSFYFYFFTNQLSPLERLLEATENIKGEFYQNIRNSFLNIVNGDLDLLKLSEEDIAKIRGENVTNKSMQHMDVAASVDDHANESQVIRTLKAISEDMNEDDFKSPELTEWLMKLDDAELKKEVESLSFYFKFILIKDLEEFGDFIKSNGVSALDAWKLIRSNYVDDILSL
ncbi:hypothetical protein V6R21_13915 [Limibacter armeniacum]|uniref:hypothetical protein n=1 Tax=Limibacter armeniacum TaxID=466084 RepID=UPI002FE69D52